MRIRLLVFAALFLGGLQGQDHAPKPLISKEPLTSEQIVIYRAVLVDYTQGEDTRLNIANTTELFSVGFGLEPDCLKGFVMPVKSGSNIVHKMEAAVLLNSSMALVNPEKQGELVKQNDPANLVHRAIDEHEHVSDKELDKSVKQAFATGLFTFSEIVFNKQHTRAMLQYSFVCGELCGNGKTIIMKNVAGKWKKSKVCGGWIS
ncbi:MAG TPA: hypothetical protein VFW31_14635 [Candidatus Angelobacter sp.]|nr:hypothetical protein [Candidatus Angelobacter sp.]